MRPPLLAYIYICTEYVLWFSADLLTSAFRNEESAAAKSGVQLKPPIFGLKYVVGHTKTHDQRLHLPSAMVMEQPPTAVMALL